MIGLDVGEAETEGLRAAIGQVLGCPWQRCSVHFLRNMLGHCAKSQQPMISAAIRGIFTASSGQEARERLADVVERLEPIAPKVAQLVIDAESDLLGFYAFRASTEASCAAPTRSSASTARSAAAPTSSASSPTTPR